MPDAIPTELLPRLREVLTRCGPFASDAELHAVFVVETLAPWRDKVPGAASPAARLDALLDCLTPHVNDRGEAMLTLFLRELATRCDPADGCRRDVREIADALEAAWGLAPASNAPLPGVSAPLPPAGGSPFVVGRPLRASEPIFGRAAAFRFTGSELAKFSSVNIVGERRMGKTSLLHHLLGHPERHLPTQADAPPLVLAHVDLQGDVGDAPGFYGKALRALCDALPPGAFDALRGRLHARPTATYTEFEGALKRMRDADAVCVRPVLVVDEFERLLAPTARAGFPFPDFFDGLRALITAELLAMVVASRRTLAETFRELPGALTSTFPSYFTPFTLDALDAEAADALLLQPGDPTLTLEAARYARQWAGGHPCHLQAAGQAWYEAQTNGHDRAWARARFDALRAQSCMTGLHTPPRRRLWEGIKRRLGL